MTAPVLLLTGLSGAGKSTLGAALQKRLRLFGRPCELIDGDDYRAALCSDLGFSKDDRIENARRLGFVARRLSLNGVTVILAAILPYRESREVILQQCPLSRTVFLDCPISELKARDPKGLYRRALYPKNHPDHLPGFTGISDPYEPPGRPDLTLRTDTMSPSHCQQELLALLEEYRV